MFTRYAVQILEKQRIASSMHDFVCLMCSYIQSWAASQCIATRVKPILHIRGFGVGRLVRVN